jgi:AbrB family looped-hinge helix DNA binding protein
MPRTEKGRRGTPQPLPPNAKRVIAKARAAQTDAQAKQGGITFKMTVKGRRYQAMKIGSAPSTAIVKMGDRGRVVLPSAVRAALKLEPGTQMLVSAEADGSLRLRPYRAVADQGRGLFAGDASAAVPAVDELIADRRAEAAREG